MEFIKATKEKAKARIALIGPSGSGKTYTALTLAGALGKNIALIDTENSSASKYADIFGFSTLSLAEFSPQTYIEAIHAAERAGFDVLVIDSLSHAWMGKGGALQMVDNAAKKYQGNSFAAWRDVTPHHNALVDALVQCPCHLIVTMRAKTEYVVTTNDKGKVEPRKVGLAPVQRDGLEYEFDIVADMDIDNTLIISKTRCSALAGGVISKPTAALGETVKAWLSDGVEPTKKPLVSSITGLGKIAFFEKVKRELAIEPEQAADILKSAGFTNGYDPTKAADYWAAIEKVMQNQLTPPLVTEVEKAGKARRRRGATEE